MKRALALLLGLCFLLGGCAQNGAAGQTQPKTPAPSFEPEPSPAPVPPDDPAPSPISGTPDGASFRDLALRLAELPDGEWQTVPESYTPAFAAYTLRTARQLFEGTSENTVYSPANLYLALCMLVETTAGESRAQLLKLLGLESVEQAREVSSTLFRELRCDTETGKTLLANSIWLNEQIPFKQDAIDHLATDYCASAFRAPMGSGETDAAIASWINENTNSLLADAAAGLKTNPEMLMMLISTLYFKGTWSKQFPEEQTAPDTFTNADGSESTVDFMHTVQKRSTYYRGDKFTAASLRFMDGTSMWFLLPDEGVSLEEALLEGGSPFTEFDAAPDAVIDTVYGPAIASEGYADIVWSMPKFDVKSSLDLVNALKALGLTDIFGANADFSPLSDMETAVSAIQHAARVKVDEEGCEAAAFTAIMLEATAMPEPTPQIEMNLNHPFGFLITGSNGLPLFIGAVNQVG